MNSNYNVLVHKSGGNQIVSTPNLRLVTYSGNVIYVNSEWAAFVNPWTNLIEMVCLFRQFKIYTNIHIHIIVWPDDIYYRLLRATQWHWTTTTTITTTNGLMWMNKKITRQIQARKTALTEALKTRSEFVINHGSMMLKFMEFSPK